MTMKKLLMRSEMNQIPHSLKESHPDLYKRLLSCDINEELQVITSKTGKPTCRLKNLYLHSAYDPVKEAERQIKHFLSNIHETETIIVFGFGFGYHIEELKEKYSGRIIVVEKDLSILKVALSICKISSLSEISIIAGKSPSEAMEDIQHHLSSENLVDAKIFCHTPSVQVNAEFYSELKSLIDQHNRPTLGNLSILIPTPIYGGSLPIAKYCRNAFQKLGHKVTFLDNSIYDPARIHIENLTSNKPHSRQLMNILVALMSESMTAAAIENAVDLVFLIAQSPISPTVIKELKRHGIPTAMWFVEDWQVKAYWQDWAPLYEYFFTIQKGEFFKRLFRQGVQQAHYLPLAADPEIHLTQTLDQTEQHEFGSDVSHVGAGYLNRRKVFSSLTEYDFKLWGSGWEDSRSLESVIQRNGERIPTEETVKIFNAAKININLHSSPFHYGVNPDGDYLNPRAYEIAACGAFQLCDKRGLLKESFTDGSEIVTFSSTGELRELINKFLQEGELRKQIAHQSQERVLQQHTYRHRMQEVLEVIASTDFVPASRSNPDHIDNLLNEAKIEPDLYEFLSKFKSNGVLTLDEIIQSIQNNKGVLSQVETIFLLMYEFRKWAREKDVA